MPASNESTGIDRTAARVLILVAFLGLASQFVGFRSSLGAIGAPFWDYGVYRFAMDRFHQGFDPYIVGPDKWSFVYPPIFLRIFSAFDFGRIYIAFVVVLVAFSVTALLPLRSRALYGLLGFLTCGSGYVAILTGNVTVFAHLFLVASCYAAFKSQRSTALVWIFAAFIVLFSAIKIYYLAYALILIVLPRRRLLLASIAVLSTGLIYGAQMLLDGDLWSLFVSSLYSSTVANGDTGYTLFFLVYDKTRSTIAGIAIHEVAVGLLAAAFVYIRWMPRGSAEIRSEGELFAVLAFVIAVNPRLKEYDICILMACLYLSFAADAPPSKWSRIWFVQFIPLTTIAAMLFAKIFFLAGFNEIAGIYTGGVLFSAAYLISIYSGLFWIAVRSPRVGVMVNRMPQSEDRTARLAD